MPLDVTDEASVKAALASVTEGRLDVLVNATGTFLMSKHALPLLRPAAGGGAQDGTQRSQQANPKQASVVNMGSYDGFISDPGLAAHCATKGAGHALTRALTRAMACDHGPKGIRVNALCPGYVDTPMLQRFFTGEGSGGGGLQVEKTVTSSTNADWRRLGSCGRHKLQRRVQ